MTKISEDKINSIPTNSKDQITKEFKFVIDLMPQMVWATQPDGYHDFFNKRWYDFTGLSYEDTKNKGWSLVLHPDDFDRTWQVWQNSLSTGITYEIEYRMRRFDGSYKWFLARAEPLRDENNKIVKWFGTCTDIQEQREILNELENTRKELRISNKDLSIYVDELSRINLELDNFVYTASHDLKTPLNNLEGLIALLEPHKIQDKNHEEIINMIDQSVKRFKGVVNDMTLIAKSAKENHKMYDVNIPLLLNEIKSDLHNLILSTNTTFILNLDIENIQYPKKEIRSILFNLISNAIKYKADNRSPQITICTKIISEEILLEVEDNSCGIEASNLPKLFDQFFQVNKTVEGSGLGLFIIKRMVNNRGGRIEVSSEVGHGSKFSIFLKMQK